MANYKTYEVDDGFHASIAKLIELANSGPLPADVIDTFRGLIDAGIDLPTEMIALVNAQPDYGTQPDYAPVYVSPAENNANTIIELVTELINLDNADPSSEISARIITKTINELLTEVINLVGIEIGSYAATSAGTIAENIQQQLTEIITLKRIGINAGNNADPNAMVSADNNLTVVAETIAAIITGFIDIENSEYSSTLETIDHFVALFIALDITDAGFETCAKIITITINERIAELIDQVGSESSSFDASFAENIKETINELLDEMMTLKKSESVPEPNADATKVKTTATNLGVIAWTIDTIISNFIYNNKNEIEIQSIKTMSNAELVSFDPLVCFSSI